MNSTQRSTIYHAKRIMDLNTNPEGEFDESFDKLKVKDLIKIVSAFPEDFLNLTFEDLENMVIDGNAEDFIGKALENMTEEQEFALWKVSKLLLE